MSKEYVQYITSNADLSIMHGQESAIHRIGLSLNKMFDYMAAGRPILVDFHSPFCSVVDCGGVIESEGNTAREIADAVMKVRIMSEEERNQYSIKARDAVKEYDFKCLTKKVIAIMQSI